MRSGARITQECGKTLEEATGEMRRAIENVEVACGIPMLSKGEVAEDIASGVDEMLLRQPSASAPALRLQFPPA